MDWENALRGRLIKKRWAHCHGALYLDFSLDIGLSRARHGIVHQAQPKEEKGQTKGDLQIDDWSVYVQQ